MVKTMNSDENQFLHSLYETWLDGWKDFFENPEYQNNFGDFNEWLQENYKDWLSDFKSRATQKDPKNKSKAFSSSPDAGDAELAYTQERLEICERRIALLEAMVTKLLRETMDSAPS